MKLSPNATIALVVLLFCSVLFNVVALVRMSDSPRPEPAGRLSAAAKPAPPAEPEWGPQGTDYRPPAEPAPRALAPRADSGAPPVEVVPLAASKVGSIRTDPRVAGVIDAQEKFGIFWKDLDKVFKARDRLEPEPYFQTVTQGTMDFLEIPEYQRGAFVSSTRAAVDAMARARREHAEARKLLPPKVKGDPAASAAYDQQKNAIDARYDAQAKSAMDMLGGNLDPKKPRHAEFIARSDNWLRYLVPKSQP
jgi:hypothetical protein